MDIESCFVCQSFYSYLLYIYSFNESLPQSLNTSILPSRQPGPLAETQVHLQEINRTQWVCTFSVSHTLSKPALWRSFIQIEFHFVLTKTRNDLQQPPAIFNDTQWPPKNPRKYTMTLTDPEKVHNSPQWSKRSSQRTTIQKNPQRPTMTHSNPNNLQQQPPVT